MDFIRSHRRDYEVRIKIVGLEFLEDCCRDCVAANSTLGFDDDLEVIHANACVYDMTTISDKATNIADTTACVGEFFTATLYLNCLTLGK